MCAFAVLAFIFHTKPRDWLEKRLRNDLGTLCRVGRKTTTQSIKHDNIWGGYKSVYAALSTPVDMDSDI